MNIKVLYHSLTGNTKKLAGAIAGAVGAEAQGIVQKMALSSEPVDLLFIGDGIYFGKPSKHTAQFISQLDLQTVKSAAVFATCGGQTKIGNDIKKLLTDKGVRVVGEPITCKGRSWGIINRKHPDDSDIRRAIRLAKEAVSKAAE